MPHPSNNVFFRWDCWWLRNTCMKTVANNGIFAISTGDFYQISEPSTGWCTQNDQLLLPRSLEVTLPYKTKEVGTWTGWFVSLKRWNFPGNEQNISTSSWFLKIFWQKNSPTCGEKAKLLAPPHPSSSKPCLDLSGWTVPKKTKRQVKYELDAWGWTAKNSGTVDGSEILHQLICQISHYL